MCNLITLDMLPVDKTGVVRCFKCCGSEIRRLQDMGLCCGVRVKAVQKSPSGDPVAYSFRGVVVALRDMDAKNIVIALCN